MHMVVPDMEVVLYELDGVEHEMKTYFPDLINKFFKAQGMASKHYPRLLRKQAF